MYAIYVVKSLEAREVYPSTELGLIRLEVGLKDPIAYMR